MKWLLYHILFAVGYTLMMPKFVWRMCRRGGYRRGFMQRFGCYDAVTLGKIREKRRLWIHAVSVGEAYVAERYLRVIRERNPGLSVVFSANTSTGHSVAQSFLGDDDILIYFPVDFPWVVKRVLNRVNPLGVIFTESELWPTFIRECAKRFLPMVLINGRISDRSFPRYRFLRSFFGPVLSKISLFLVQGEVDRERLCAIGASKGAIHVVGSAKYDIGARDRESEARIISEIKKMGLGGDVIILVGGSTWPGEEAVLTRCLQSLRGEYPRLRLLLVPRHAERGNEVAAELRAMGENVLQRSSAETGAERSLDLPDILLADTTGELSAIYRMADIVFVGKSLFAHGGQNFIEPASFGKPVVVGPFTGNFPTAIREFREADAIIEVSDETELCDAIRRSLSDTGYSKGIAERGEALVASKAGVVARSVDMISGFLTF